MRAGRRSEDVSWMAGKSAPSARCTFLKKFTVPVRKCTVTVHLFAGTVHFLKKVHRPDGALFGDARLH